MRRHLYIERQAAALPRHAGTQGLQRTRDDREGPGTVLSRRHFGQEQVVFLITRNGFHRVDWPGQRRWLGTDPETARQTFQRYCLHAFLLDCWRGLRRRFLPFR